MKLSIHRKSAAALAGASVLAALGAPYAAAQPGDSTLFAVAELDQGYLQVARADAEGKCGEGKCGETKSDAEGTCGEGKCGESKSDAEGKCGESKSDAEGKCGEGKCGAA